MKYCVKMRPGLLFGFLCKPNKYAFSNFFSELLIPVHFTWIFPLYSNKLSIVIIIEVNIKIFQHLELIIQKASNVPSTISFRNLPTYKKKLNLRK